MERHPDVASQLVEVIDEQYLRGDQQLSTVISSLIRSVRSRLRMEVGFISEFSDDQRIFRFVDCGRDADIVAQNSCGPLEDSFCEMIADGRLSQLVPDTRSSGEMDMVPEFASIPVASHVSVPVELSDGSTYGTFCVFSRYSMPSLNNRSLTMVRVFADVIASLIEDSRSSQSQAQARREYIMQLLNEDKLMLYAQPVYSLASDQIEGYELLSRVSDDIELSPAEIFLDAERLGLSSLIGMRVLDKAREALAALPAHHYVAINVTPSFLMDVDMTTWFEPADRDRIVLEITEHDAISDYIGLQERLAPLRKAGMRLAIDDAGAGYASFRHILKLGPDVVKLDMSLIRDIDCLPEKQALVAALYSFALNQGYRLIAEGVETEPELKLLKQLSISCGQGFLLSRPQPISTFSECH